MKIKICFDIEVPERIASIPEIQSWLKRSLIKDAIHSTGEFEIEFADKDTPPYETEIETCYLTSN